MAVGSLPNYIKALNNQPVKNGYVRFYRGHACNKWNLEPSLLRAGNENLLEKETELIQELHIHYPEIFKDSENIFEDLVIAQHYGIPTRLLDVTSNPLVALYFAITNIPPKAENPEVLIIDIPKDVVVYYDNQKVLDDLNNVIHSEGKPLHYPIACIKARLNNPRIVRQSGAFLLLSEKHDKREVVIEHIELSKNNIRRLFTQLAGLGITTQSLFPELSQYALCLKNKEIEL
ncbi:MAG: FRG domain-containing protein [Paramuribaculum sp.]|nr:FRG domain-containing protein [Paramuribaculum sp.]